MVQTSTVDFARERFIKSAEPKPKITYTRTVDKPATRAVEAYEKAKGGSKKSKSKSKKSKKSSKILGKPKGKIIQSLSAVKAIRGMANATDSKMVSPGKEGFMDKEMMKERMEFFGGYTL